MSRFSYLDNIEKPAPDQQRRRWFWRKMSFYFLVGVAALAGGAWGLAADSVATALTDTLLSKVNPDSDATKEKGEG